MLKTASFLFIFFILSQILTFFTLICKEVIQLASMKPDCLGNRNTWGECPKCGNSSLVQKSHDSCQCFFCGFSQDVDQPERGGIWFLMAILFFILMVSSNRNDLRSPELNSPNSEQVSSVR